MDGAFAAIELDRPQRLVALRQELRRLERGGGAVAPPLALGLPAVDAALGGGLALGALHEVAGGAEDAAADGFATALLGRLVAARGRPVLWCPAGDDLYAPGLAGLGLDPGRVILVRAGRPADRLWAMEEGLRSPALAGVLGELPELGLTDGRRLQLAAESGGTLGLVLRRGRRRGAAGERPSAAASRWRIAAAPTPSAGLEGRWPAGGPARLVGPPRWRIELTRCRGGRPGEWLVEWDDETDRFRMVAALCDRADPAAPGG
jgi:protein ImuA